MCKNSSGNYAGKIEIRVFSVRILTAFLQIDLTAVKILTGILFISIFPAEFPEEFPHLPYIVRLKGPKKFA
jgi:hypothetical protein